MYPTVTDKNGIQQYEGKKVLLTGKYQQHDIRKNKIRATSPPEYHGDVVIRLDDGTDVLLYPVWHAEKIRPDEEIIKYDNKRVIVHGRIFAIAPDSRQGMANLLMPCITDVEGIEECYP
jgi:hypothetical protein